MNDLSINIHRTKAILVGVSDYKHLSAIKPALGNIEDFAQILTDKNLLGLPRENIYTVKNKRNDEIEDEITSILKDPANVNFDTLIFYYTGHGIRENMGSKELFLTGINTKRSNLHSSSIRYNNIKNKIEKGNWKKRIVILDACHSGLAAMDDETQKFTTNEIDIKGTYILTSSADEESFFDDSDRNTFFTGELIHLLKNGLPNQNPLLALDDIYGYLQSNFKKSSPQRKSNLNTADLYVFRNPQYDKAALLIKQAKKYYNAGDYKQAIDQYKIVIAELTLSGNSDQKRINRIKADIRDAELHQKVKNKLLKNIEKTIIDKTSDLQTKIEQLEKLKIKQENQLVELTNENKKTTAQYQQKVKDLTGKISDLQTQLKTLQAENKNLKNKTNFDIEILEQAQQFVEKRNGKWNDTQWKQFCTPLIKKYQWSNDDLLGKICERERRLFVDRNKSEKKITDLQNTIKQDQVIYNKLKTEKETIEKELQKLKNPPKPKPGKDSDIVWQNDKHGTFTDPRDGKKYKVVKTRSQIWLAENLNFTKDIPHITDRAQWKKLGNNDKDAAWCYYDNKSENGEKYGALYTWAAALKVAPKGWHLPTKEEFKALLEQFGGEDENAYKALIEGKSDLNVRFAGWRFYNGKFSTMLIHTGFWSATGSNNTYAWNCNLNAYNKYAFISLDDKSVGLSVRLLRD